MKWDTYSIDGYADTLWCDVIVQIRNNSTGVIIEFNSDGCYDEDTCAPSTYIWEDGNFSCDCSRRDMFDENNTDETRGEGEYSVNVLHPDTRYAVYREFGSVERP